MEIMPFLILVLLMIVVINTINERFVHLQSDIALVLFSLFISGALLAVSRLLRAEGFTEMLEQVGSFDFETYLLDFVLCFMLFAGAGNVNMGKFKTNIKAVSLLALLSTVVSSTLYGALFWVFARMFSIEMDIWVCILLGCIVSPTDPIAATGILNKLGMSKNVTSIIENESLFNDGTGVALFVFVKSIVQNLGESNFAVVMAKEVFGALAVAFAISFIMFRLLKLSHNPVNHILISLLDVSTVYVICEHFGFSGVIASVICGMYFAYGMEGIARRRQVDDPHNLYSDFWEVLDHVLNAILFVMIGISVLNLHISRWIPLLVPAGVLAVVLSRFAGVWVSSVLVGKKKLPSSYSRMEFVLLMTWSALKGGLSLALAMSTKEFLTAEVYQIVLNTAYITIFFTVIVQGLTVKNVYHKIEKHKAKRLQEENRKRSMR